MAGFTIFRCSHCGKELLPGQRSFCENFNTTECPQCSYLHALGVYTSADYNKWLKNEWNVPNKSKSGQ